MLKMVIIMVMWRTPFATIAVENLMLRNWLNRMRGSGTRCSVSTNIRNRAAVTPCIGRCHRHPSAKVSGPSWKWLSDSDATINVSSRRIAPGQSVRLRRGVAPAGSGIGERTVGHATAIAMHPAAAAVANAHRHVKGETKRGPKAVPAIDPREDAMVAIPTPRPRWLEATDAVMIG